MKTKNNNTKAVIYMLISALSYSLIQYFVKLTTEVSFAEKIFARNILSAVVAFIILKKNNSLFFGKKENQKYLFGRTLGGVFGMSLFFVGTMEVSLSIGAIINKLAPVMVVIGSHFFLKEKITKSHIFAVTLALLGSWAVIQPAFDSSFFSIIILLLSAVLSAIAFLSLKALGEKENVYTVIFHYSFISVVLSLPFLIFDHSLLGASDLLSLSAISVLATGGQIALTYAYKLAPASKVSVYDYSNIIFSSVIGYVFLSEIPDIFQILGISIIILASIITYKSSN